MDPVATLKRGFWNESEGRPRALWRLLVGTLGIVALALALVILLGPLVAAAASAGLLVGLPSVVALAANQLLLAVAVVAGVALAIRYFDRRPPSDVGLGLDREWWIDLGVGTALGAGLMTAIFLTELAAGWVAVAGVGRGGAALASALAAGAVMMVAVGVWEEVLFRGYYLVNAAEGLRALPGVDARRAALAAAGLTSVAFGLGHGFNAGATPVSTTFVTVYGAYLAAAFLLTGDLALPIGFHAAWNYVQGFVYGFPVSGLAAAASVVETEPTGPPVLTGGAFGPEGGLVALAWVALSVPALRWWARRRGGGPARAADAAVPDLRGGRPEAVGSTGESDRAATPDSRRRDE